MIYELLPVGKANPRSGKELAQALNCDIRDITEQISRERRAGLPICASSNARKPGYYIAETPEELQQYCDALKGRAIEVFKTRQALVKILKKIQEGRGELKS